MTALYDRTLYKIEKFASIAQRNEIAWKALPGDLWDICFGLIKPYTTLLCMGEIPQYKGMLKDIFKEFGDNWNKALSGDENLNFVGIATTLCEDLHNVAHSLGQAGYGDDPETMVKDRIIERLRNMSENNICEDGIDRTI